jgi:hypothetical protein
MITVEKLSSFKVLTIDGSNYLAWCLKAKASLTAKGLQDTIIMDIGPTLENEPKPYEPLSHHLDYNF